MTTVPPTLTAAEALAVRLRSLLLRDADADAGTDADSAPRDVAGVVTWFGAMQAQDLGSGLWSLGVRLPHLTRADVEQALERREALRTWPMRGTVHLVPAHDARWMLDTTGVRALAGAERRRAILGLDAAVADHAVDVLAQTLAGGRRLTRAECVAALEAAGISGAGQRAYHLLWYASQRGVTCIAPNVGTEQTIVLLDEWAPDQRRLDREEALATLATRYFRSHGPTTRQDFAGWTMLTAADARAGIAAAGDAIAAVDVDGTTMYADPAIVAEAGSRAEPPADDEWRVLPGFDEFLLGYKDRSWMLRPGDLDAVIPGGNGVFRGTVSRGGRVAATWTRTERARAVVVDVTAIRRLSARDRNAVTAAFAPYARYLGRNVDVRWGA